jgi:hypothetical protein
LPFRGPERVKEFSISHVFVVARGLPASPE